MIVKCENEECNESSKMEVMAATVYIVILQCPECKDIKKLEISKINGDGKNY